MPGRTLQEWLRAEKIDWDAFWSCIDHCDRYVKKNRPSGARFNSDGSVRSTYSQIAAQLDLDYPNKETFVAGIVNTALRIVNYPRKRMHWEKG
ncbi:MAG: hypothetical protein NTU83_05960 [Candidatus Hydrogenedentes bacterium]|nr:hypothetical protein [Candidatus Hydrogenedentota bacterium]